MANKYTDFQNGLAMALAAGAASGGAGVTEITKAEYDALSEEEKNNGKLYLINDYAEGGIVSSDVSGMESTVLWEGIEYADATTKEVPFDHSIDDYDMVYVFGAYIDTKEKTSESYNSILILKQDYYIKPSGTASDVWAFCINNSTENSSRRLIFSFSSDKVIKIRSDFSSSGKLMGLTKIIGLKFKAKVYKPENEYSLEEKRIGTWIDGKPLYQKTFSNVHWTNDSISIPIENVEVVNMWGYARSTSNTNIVFFNYTVDNNTRLISWVDYETHNIEFRSTYAEHRGPLTCTIQYTKTTD